MRSYPLLGLFLATRHAVSKTTSSPAILRPTATGVSLLFLSLKHSSAAIEVRVTGVICWPQCGEPILPLPGSASQKRKPRERESSWASHLLHQTKRWVQMRRDTMPWNTQCLGSLKECRNCRYPRNYDSFGWRWGPGKSDAAGRQIQFWKMVIWSGGSGSELCLDSQARVSLGAMVPSSRNRALCQIIGPTFSIQTLCLLQGLLDSLGLLWEAPGF